MPYINKNSRERLEEAWSTPQDCGELNYSFTKLINAYIGIKGEKNQTYNDIIGALEGAKMELYRRKVANYENMKRIDNGDVYND